MFKLLSEIITEILFPSFCPICQEKVGSRGAWCPECLSISTQNLQITNTELKYLDGCLILCHYQDGVNKIIKGIKYYNQLKYSENVFWLLQNLHVIDNCREIDMVVPVPLHSKRLQERGYNQTEKMYKKWAMQHNLAWDEGLKRIRETQPQYQLKIKERKENLKNAFAVKDDFIINGKNILLVDDIYTTGTTLEECAKVLKKAGAEKIFALALAINI